MSKPFRHPAYVTESETMTFINSLSYLQAMVMCDIFLILMESHSNWKELLLKELQQINLGRIKL